MGAFTPLIKSIKGEKGDPGLSSSIEGYLAGEAVGGHRVVYIKGDSQVYYASNDDSTLFGATVGLTTGAAVLGAPVAIAFNGIVDEPSWTWTPQELLYLGTNGLLTQTPPSGGGALFSQVVGFAITATKIQVQIAPPILLP